VDDINRADKALDCLMSETGSAGRCQDADEERAAPGAYHVVVARKLVGTGELVRMLGLSRTRVGHLVAQPGFPAPYDELIMGKVWRIKDVEKWAADHGRKVHPLDAD
jgi:hypothetical protein